MTAAIKGAYYERTTISEAADSIVSQHERIVAAKDAEIARFSEVLYRERIDEDEQRRKLEAAEENIAGLRAEIAGLLAQPARQVGGDEQISKPGLFCRDCGDRLCVRDVCTIYCPACERECVQLDRPASKSGGDEEEAFNQWHRSNYEWVNHLEPCCSYRFEGWQAHAALAPAAAAIPDGCVAVPRELLDSAATWLEVHSPAGGCIERDTAEELRALLSQAAEIQPQDLPTGIDSEGGSHD
ncbi:hypothetical protein FQZ97_795040 [compost metagenome]